MADSVEGSIPVGEVVLVHILVGVDKHLVAVVGSHQGSNLLEGDIGSCLDKLALLLKVDTLQREVR